MLSAKVLPKTRSMVLPAMAEVMVPPHDAEALGTAIARLLTDHPYADSLARAGHDLVHERFCIERMVADIEGIYDEGARISVVPELAAG